MSIVNIHCWVDQFCLELVALGNRSKRKLTTRLVNPLLVSTCETKNRHKFRIMQTLYTWKENCRPPSHWLISTLIKQFSYQTWSVTKHYFLPIVIVQFQYLVQRQKPPSWPSATIILLMCASSKIDPHQWATSFSENYYQCRYSNW